MNDLQRFESLARRARGEKAPAVDVTAKVLGRIRQLETRREVDLPLVAVCGLSLLAASILVATAIQLWAPLLDPMAGLFSSLNLVVL